MLSAEDALADCVRVFPAFRAYWDEEDNPMRDDDGSFTVCGVYSVLTWFVKERWSCFREADWRAFATMASDHFRRSEEPASTIGPCLIENLEGEDYSPLV